jgi:hypothetical protein
MVNLVLCISFNLSVKHLFSVTSSIRSLRSVACSVWKYRHTRTKSYSQMNTFWSFYGHYLIDEHEFSCYMDALVLVIPYIPWFLKPWIAPIKGGCNLLEGRDHQEFEELFKIQLYSYSLSMPVRFNTSIHSECSCSQWKNFLNFFLTVQEHFVCSQDPYPEQD